MTTMIDKVTEAIANEINRQGETGIADSGGGVIIDLTLLARAAIEAMGEPLAGEEIANAARDAGMQVELGAQYSVRGQIARLINCVHRLKEPYPE